MDRLTYSEWHNKVNHYLEVLNGHIPLSAFNNVGNLRDAAKEIVRSEFGAPLPDPPKENASRMINTYIPDTDNTQVWLNVPVGMNVQTVRMTEDETENFIGDLQEHLRYVRALRELQS